MRSNRLRPISRFFGGRSLSPAGLLTFAFTRGEIPVVRASCQLGLDMRDWEEQPCWCTPAHKYVWILSPVWSTLPCWRTRFGYFHDRHGFERSAKSCPLDLVIRCGLWNGLFAWSWARFLDDRDDNRDFSCPKLVRNIFACTPWKSRPCFATVPKTCWP